MLKPSFTDPRHAQDPAVIFDALRRQGAVARVRLPLLGAVWMTSSHAATSAMLKNDERFSLRKPGKGGAPVGLQWWMPRTIRLLANNMLTSDSADHRRLRKLVDQAFQRRAVGELEERVKAIAHRLLDDVPRGAKFDLVSQYARQLPLAVICELLGLNEDQQRAFSRDACKVTSVSGIFDFVWSLGPIARMRRLLDGVVREEKRLQRWQEQHAANDDNSDDKTSASSGGLIAELVRAETEEGRLSHDELVAMIFLLLMAGHETTTHAISSAVLCLLQDPAARNWLAEDPTRYDLMVEEMLRFNSPVQFSKPRYVNTDGDFHGAALKKGDVIMACLGAANRDPDVYDNPDQLDLQRRPNPHLEFGTGIHFCLGFQLARLEMRTAIAVLFQRCPDLALVGDGVEWSSRLGMRALSRLAVKS